MAKSVSLGGQDTIEVGQQTSRQLVNLADKDYGHFTFQDSIVDMTVGKDGISMQAFNQKGLKGELAVRVIRGSSDDIFLSMIAQQEIITQLVGFYPVSASVTKMQSDQAGNITPVTYLLSGGTIKSLPELVSNAEGNTDMLVAVWTIQGVVEIVQG